MTRSIFFALLLFAALKSHAQQPMAIIPFMVQGSHTFIKVKFSQEKEYLFLFDTGAGSSVTTPGLAREEQLVLCKKDTVLESAGGANRVPISLDNTLHLGATSVAGVNLFIEDLSHMKFQGKAVDGAIGYELLRNFVTVINYDKNQLELYPKGSQLYATHSSIPFQLLEEIPAIDLVYTLPTGKKVKGLFHFDTGGGFSLLFSSALVKEGQLLDAFPKKAKSPAMGASAGLSFYNYLVSVPQVQLNDQVFNDVPASVSMAEEGLSSSALIHGILGNDIICRFNVVLDYQKNEMKLVRNSRFASPFVFNLTGLSFRMQDDQVVVSNVMENSPAGAAGIQKNDVILAVDGVPFRSAAELRKTINKENGTFTIRLLRKEEQVEVQLKAARFY